MWAVIKFDNKKIGFFKNQLNQKFGKDSKFYCPKILIKKFKNNKLINKEFNLLGDYIFCFNKKFSESIFLNQVKYTKGVKYILDGITKSQSEIEEFILKCKNVENSEGYITQNLYEGEINQLYKFSSGPFAQKIFKILEFQKNKISILMGNIKTNIKKKICYITHYKDKKRND